MERLLTQTVNLTMIDVFFIITTIISLVLNILQWRESKASKDPLSNALIGIFNDIKSKTNAVYFVYNALFNQNNPHKDVPTLRWEYGLFMQNVLGFFQGIQEQVVASLCPCALRTRRASSRSVPRTMDLLNRIKR